MGFLELTPSGFGGSIADFSQAIIAFWFRVPSSTFATMAAKPDFSPAEFEALQEANQANSDRFGIWGPGLGTAFSYKVLPLFTFGSVEVDSFGLALPPSFIGINFLEAFLGITTLTCNLQTPVLHGGTFEDNGNFRPGCYNMGGWAVNSGNPVNATITPDVWHHAIVSFDISGGSSGTVSGEFQEIISYAGSSTFTWALDGASKVGQSMYPSGGGDYVGDPKVIVPQGVIEYQPGREGGTVSYGSTYIKAFGKAVGVPSHSAYIPDVQIVEMADLYFWTGTSTDAAGAVPLFIDGLVPTDGSEAIAAFGTPNIIFRKLRNWQTGLNLGSAGNLARTGTIAQFTPGPGL